MANASPDKIKGDIEFIKDGKGSVSGILSNPGDIAFLPAGSTTLSAGQNGLNTLASLDPGDGVSDAVASSLVSLDLRKFLKDLLQDRGFEIVTEAAPRQELILEGQEGYFGPFLTTGYEYMIYDAQNPKKTVFPLYIDYVKDKDGNWVMKSYFDQ